MSNIEYRHPTENDVDSITRVVNESSRELPMHRDETTDETRRWFFEDPDLDLDGYLLAVDGDMIVGMGGSIVHKSRQESGLMDAFVEIYVVPDCRGKGIEQHFMKFTLDYLRKKDVKHAKCWFHGTGGWRHDLAQEFGMRDVRHGYAMLYNSKETPVESSLPDGFEYVHMMITEASDSEIEDFVASFNESFQDHWNFSPVPASRFIKLRDEEKENIGRFTYAKKDGKTAGVCYYGVATSYNKQHNALTGWSNILGVKKPFRRMGLGRALLSNSMKWLWDRGMRELYLGVDAENKKALDLYTTLGYTVNRESITYELTLE